MWNERIYDELTVDSTPNGDDFYMPAEWMAHARCWMLWPERKDVWRENAQPAQHAFAAVARAVSRFEPVTMGVSHEAYWQARGQLPESVELIRMRYNDAWMRDIGPTFVVSQQGELRGVNWQFNAWGGLYADWSDDAEVARSVLQHCDVRRYEADLIMEGGSFHVDGDGTVLAVSENLLHPSRNPQLSRDEIEERLCDYLGARKVIWLPYGVYEDETDGHVNQLVRFVAPGVVVLTWTEDIHDPQYGRSQAAYEVLSQATDARGRSLEIHRLHQPGPLYMSHEEAFGVERRGGTYERTPGQRLAGSYVNYYVANGAVIMPTFNDPYDDAARAKLQELYPEREVVGVSAREILLGGGNIHSIIQEEPRTRPPE